MAAGKKALVVTGPVAVIRVKDGGGDRYLYRGAIVDPSAYEADSIEHVEALGLLGEIEVVDETASDESNEPYKGVTVPNLEAEIAKRNEGRDDDKKIAPKGTKRDDLVSALVADDAAQS